MSRRLWFASLLAPIFLLSGLSFPYSAGIVFFDLRLTLANLGFLFNTAFTLLSVLVIEKALAEQIDLADGSAADLASKIVKQRTLGVLLYFVSLLCVILVILSAR